MAKTLTEQFGNYLSGRYAGQPKLLWLHLGRCWEADEVLDVTENSRRVRLPNGNIDLTPALCEAISEAIETQDHVRLLVLCDQAEELGVSEELCDLTRLSLRTQYPATT